MKKETVERMYVCSETVDFTLSRVGVNPLEPYVHFHVFPVHRDIVYLLIDISKHIQHIESRGFDVKIKLFILT